MFREDILIPLVTHKDVLDCGGADYCFAEKKQKSGTWLHAIISKHSRSCLGVDILEHTVNSINSTTPYTFTKANVENLPFNNEFDVVVAGELIEHLHNAGHFLDSAWRALRTNGILVITTPNYLSWTKYIYSVTTGKEKCREDHTCYYGKQTLTYLVTNMVLR